MRHIVSLVAAVAIILFGVYATTPAAAPIPASVVKVLVGDGHGSGVHIGNGYIITAAHVTQGKPVKLKLTDGTEIAAETLWENRNYDVALVRTSARLAASPLSCDTAPTGARLRALGNPMGLEFLESVGRVAGGPREFGPWKSVLPVDMTIVMGMSGGPVFATDGRVIGISVGVLVAHLGFVPSLTGFGAIVPSSVVCALLGRA